jgi:hypothetical protein
MIDGFLDNDLFEMTEQDLFEEVIKLREAIRKHRDAKGHNLCWWVPELWNLLPESVDIQPEVPPKDEFLRCCGIYRDSLNDVTVA